MKLRAENLVKKYGVRTVVKGVNMEVEQGEIVGFLGPNGAGKTTSFYMITGQIKPNGGRIFIDDDQGGSSEITTLPMYKRAQQGIGYLPQEASVFRRMSVEDNIMSVMEVSSSTKDMTNFLSRQIYFATITSSRVSTVPSAKVSTATTVCEPAVRVSSPLPLRPLPS